MKTTIVLLALTLMGVTAFSQNTETILNDYLRIKDALVASDAKGANEGAISLEKSVTATDSFEEKENLLKAVVKMVKATNLEKQRVVFADLSTILWKEIKINSDLQGDVYYQYCPMKKAYWLSKESAIKNPYFGSKMLTCGNVSEKIIR